MLRFEVVEVVESFDVKLRQGWPELLDMWKRFPELHSNTKLLQPRHGSSVDGSAPYDGMGWTPHVLHRGAKPIGMLEFMDALQATCPPRFPKARGVLHRKVGESFASAAFSTLPSFES